MITNANPTDLFGLVGTIGYGRRRFSPIARMLQVLLGCFRGLAEHITHDAGHASPSGLHFSAGVEEAFSGDGLSFSVGDIFEVGDVGAATAEGNGDSFNDDVNSPVLGTLATEPKPEMLEVGGPATEEAEEPGAVGDGIEGEVVVCGIAEGLEFFFTAPQ